MSFYETDEWRKLRYKVLRTQGFKCRACGSGPEKLLQVDHIKPRSKYPELELEETNLQVLCEDCNMGKSNTYEDKLVDHDEFATEKEKHIKKQNLRILSNLSYYTEQAGLDDEGKARVRKILERELKIQGLRERSRRLMKLLKGGANIEHLVTAMFEQPPEKYERNLEKAFGSEPDGAA